MKRFLKYWAPAILWIIVVNVMSTGTFSAADTGRVLFWIFSHLGIAPGHWNFLHFLVRKAGHVTEYSILSGTLFWSLRGTTLPGIERAWDFRWARAAWLICTLVAILDELHQSYVPGRTPAVHDVALDSAAAAGVQFVLWLVLRHRRRHPAPRGRGTTAEATTPA